MPSLGLHLTAARSLAVDLDSPLIESDRGAYYLGATTPDIRVLTKWDRAHTHFFDLDDFTDQDGVHRLFEREPALRDACSVGSSTAAFLAGYISHLVLDEDYITVALAKGLSPRRVAVNYAARNAVLPQLSSFALSLGFIVGGTLIMELIFSYPGLGLRLFEATLAKDYPLMQGMFLVITLSVLVANIIADVVYAIMDPRTRQEAV